MIPISSPTFVLSNMYSTFRPPMPGNNLLLLLLSLFIAYLLIARLQRYRNHSKIKTIAAPYAHDLNTMHYSAAHQIIKLMIEYEYPFMYFVSMQLALVKSYAVGRDVKLLVDTAQLGTKEHVGRRVEDTGLILAEILLSGVDSDRGRTALAKMNWLHRRYGSLIRNDSMIFTLALFVLEPVNWISTHEWRPMSREEQVALFVYWKEIGFRMGIVDLPATIDELREWQDEYVAKKFEAWEGSTMLANRALELYMRPLPKVLQWFGKGVLTACLDPHTRSVLVLPDPTEAQRWTLYLLLALRRFGLRLLMLPRWTSAVGLGEKGPDGRLRRRMYVYEPWYVEDGVWARVWARISLLKRPVPGPAFKSKGYLPEELGPARYETVCKHAVLEESRQLRDYALEGGSSTGCPFAFKMK